MSYTSLLLDYEVLQHRAAAAAVAEDEAQDVIAGLHDQAEPGLSPASDLGAEQSVKSL